MSHLATGDRVIVELNKSLRGGSTQPVRYLAVIVREGYRSELWVVARESDGREEMVHECFLTRAGKSATPTRVSK
jgi:hypothetical protein